MYNAPKRREHILYIFLHGIVRSTKEHIITLGFHLHFFFSFLGVTEDISLRVKSGALNIGAMGDYLKDVQRRDNYVEILVKSTYETFTETMHTSANPIPDWDLLSPSYLGTHFVRSITYGGVMLASLRLYVGTTVSAADEVLRFFFSKRTFKLHSKPSSICFQVVTHDHVMMMHC
jgi:hypothetical protein